MHHVLCFVRPPGKGEQPFDENGLGFLLNEYYIKPNKPIRACHPRDLLDEIVDISRYKGIPPALSQELIRMACRAYFVDL